ncbi:MAG: ribonuclease III [Deltaproteobacteria bacterium]|nr:ribonuclease III [Deltaproteobacteria bacterium]
MAVKSEKEISTENSVKTLLAGSENLQKKAGVKFKNFKLLELALTHTSYVHEHKLSIEESNERLEFLGDAVLGICIAEMLIRAFPEEPEGALSKRRAALVNQKQLARLAGTIDLGPALRLGKGEEKTGGRTKASLLGDAFEAMIGGLYLDQGLEVVQEFLNRLFIELIPVSKKVETSQDYKTRLQEYHQREFKRSPRYIIVKESGPDHLKTFEVRIEFAGKVLGEGAGRSKRDAEQDAAKKAFETLGGLEITSPRNRHRKSKQKSKTAG